MQYSNAENLSVWQLEISDCHTEKRKGIVKMSKYYIIIAHDGTEVIDNTVDAEDRIATMDYLESRYRRECERRNNHHGKCAKNPLFRLASLCGIV